MAYPPDCPPGVSRAWIVGHPETRAGTTIGVTATVAALSWVAIIVLVSLTAAQVLPDTTAMVEVVACVIGVAVVASGAAITATGVQFLERAVARGQATICEGVDELADRFSTYDQAVGDVVAQIASTDRSSVRGLRSNQN